MKRESTDETEVVMAEMPPDTRRDDGCHGIPGYVNLDGREGLLSSELRESKNHYEKNPGWRQETGVLERAGALVEEPPGVRYLEASDA